MTHSPGFPTWRFLPDIQRGTTVLDLGCGVGLDSLVAARRVGPHGGVYGVDFSDAMLARAREAIIEAGLANAEVVQGDAEDLPLRDGVMDLALCNAIFNLNHARDSVFREMARELRPGGTTYAAELVLGGPLPQETRESATYWFA